MEIEIENDAINRCLAYINSESQPRIGAVQKPRLGVECTAVAISRETGSGAVAIAQELAQYLDKHYPSHDRPWTVFEKNLIKTILEDQHLPERLARFLPEDRISALDDTVDEVLGVHPPSWVIVKNSARTMVRLAELGFVILVGRGAPVITRRLPNVLEVRLVGSLEKRLRRVQEMEHLDARRARAFIHDNDRGRERYVRKYFREDVKNPLLYDLIINTDRMPDEEVVRLIGDAVLAGRPPSDEARAQTPTANTDVGIEAKRALQQA